MSDNQPTATELLKDRLFVAYQSRKFTAIWDIVQAQMRINTDLEVEVARLTTENETLRAFAASADAFEVQQSIVKNDPDNSDAWLKLDRLWARYRDARRRLVQLGFTDWEAEVSK